MDLTEVLINTNPDGYAGFTGALVTRLREYFTFDQIETLTNLDIKTRSHPILIRIVHEIGLEAASCEYATWKFEPVPTIVLEFADIEFIGESIFGGRSDERLVYRDLNPIVLKLMVHPDLTPDQVHALLQHCVDRYRPY